MPEPKIAASSNSCSFSRKPMEGESYSIGKHRFMRLNLSNQVFFVLPNIGPCSYPSRYLASKAHGLALVGSPLLNSRARPE
jgi:hypothetical protein